MSVNQKTHFHLQNLERAPSAGVNLKSTSTFACVSGNRISTRTFEILRDHASIPLTNENFYTLHLQSGDDFFRVHFSLTPALKAKKPILKEEKASIFN